MQKVYPWPQPPKYALNAQSADTRRVAEATCPDTSGQHIASRGLSAECSKSFGAIYDLKQHLRSIYTQTQLLCEMCSKQFNCRTSLARHRAVKHASTSKYTCEQCRKGFYERSSFIGHMNAHNGLQTVHMQWLLCFVRLEIEPEASYEDMSKQQPNSKSHMWHLWCEAQLKGYIVRPCKGPKNMLCPCGKSFSWGPSFARHKKSCTYSRNWFIIIIPKPYFKTYL